MGWEHWRSLSEVCLVPDRSQLPPECLDLLGGLRLLHQDQVWNAPTFLQQPYNLLPPMGGTLTGMHCRRGGGGGRGRPGELLTSLAIRTSVQS